MGKALTLGIIVWMRKILITKSQARQPFMGDKDSMLYQNYHRENWAYSQAILTRLQNFTDHCILGIENTRL